MTSRVGSLIVVGLLGILAVIAAVVIVILLDDNGAADDSALISVSPLRNGDLVLLGEPTEIRVTVRDDEPVAGVSLLVDGTVIVRDATPVFDPAQGTFSATLSWVPDRLGFVTITIKTLGLSGEESETEFGVEVTDDPALVAAALQVSILAPLPFQRVALNRPLSVLTQARSEEEITAFTLEVEGVQVDETTARESQSGAEVGVLAWTPSVEGETVLRVRARTASGAEDVAEVRVEVVSEALVAGDETTTAEDAASGAEGVLAIGTPEDQAEFDFSEDLSIDVSIVAVDTGRLLNMELYVNGMLFASVQPQQLADGSYRLTIPFQPPEAGRYELEAVAISELGDRFDDQVQIEVVGEEAEAEEEPAGLPDLVPTSVGVGEGNAVVVTIANQGDVPIQSTSILVSVTRSADGLLLDEATVTLALSPGGARTVTLPVALAEAIEITVIIDTADVVAEADEGNNAISTRFEPPTRPDLVARELQLSLDRIAIVRIDNVGTVNYSGQIRVLVLFNGEMVEQLSFTGVLAVQGSLTLSGSTLIEGAGQLSAVVDPTNEIAEANESNNTVTIDVAP